MPAGTCRVCGCTEAHACELGCLWVGDDREYCSQCVCWAALRTPNPYQGILPYGLVPVRRVDPMPTNHPMEYAYPVDQRRIGPEARQRLAFAIAPLAGQTAEEFLDALEHGGCRALALPASYVYTVQVAKSVEEAAAALEEFRVSGKVRGGRRIDIYYPAASVRMAHQGGRARG